MRQNKDKLLMIIVLIIFAIAGYIYMNINGIAKEDSETNLYTVDYDKEKKNAEKMSIKNEIVTFSDDKMTVSWNKNAYVYSLVGDNLSFMANFDNKYNCARFNILDVCGYSDENNIEELALWACGVPVDGSDLPIVYKIDDIEDTIVEDIRVFNANDLISECEGIGVECIAKDIDSDFKSLIQGYAILNKSKNKVLVFNIRGHNDEDYGMMPESKNDMWLFAYDVLKTIDF